ncbi:MAG: hypothetical protein ACREQ4_14895, partial [Candidatus Binataceae bacterium]
MEELDTELLRATARRLGNPSCAMRLEEIARSVATVCELWRSRAYPPRHAAVTEIARAWSFSPALLDASFDASLMPFTAAAIEACAKPGVCRLAGLILPGNVPGAGLHEVVLALIRGASVIIKTASAEPVFFRHFVKSLIEADARLG